MKIIFSTLFALALVAAGQGQTTTQTFQLRNGWNSIWLELEPTNSEIGAVLGNLPVSSVWTYVARGTSVEFIQQQTEQLFNEPSWQPYFPPSRPEAFLTKLYSVHALRAYLL